MRYDYEVINGKSYPTIRGIIVTPTTREELTMRVDTGFEGYLLIPHKMYKKLDFFKREHPISEFPVIETVTGMVTKIRSAPAKLCIEDIEMNIDVWTMPECNEILLGLDVINEMVLKLNGIEKVLEIIKPQ